MGAVRCCVVERGHVDVGLCEGFATFGDATLALCGGFDGEVGGGEAR